MEPRERQLVPRANDYLRNLEKGEGESFHNAESRRISCSHRPPSSQAVPLPPGPAPPDVASKDGGQFDCKEFMDDGMYCTRESNPHCGTDGMTYGNKCSFCKAVKRSQGSVRLEHLGKC
ncbi:serine protease inhibitor Kazal-type 12-like isoform X2 [Chrysemys picta bellii]|uniref:serine protease inhibitor Kazal-type 12-like isoform X2 n=1 Tax=Chrysemys picta bellii TaxID=8478 RepID=UPI0032B25330